MNSHRTRRTAAEPGHKGSRPFRSLGMVKRLILGAERRGNEPGGVPRLRRSTTFTEVFPPHLQLRTTSPGVTLSGSGGLVLHEICRFNLSIPKSRATTASRPPVVGISEQSAVFSHERRIYRNRRVKRIRNAGIVRAYGCAAE